uniref:Protein kinase domain-containing protein n=1 Tax=Daphnia galeata TaxID=27404 RepID=A0A8J2RVX8_9CRUS|nr:unnamed protein product [Daphnia galeata]
MAPELLALRNFNRRDLDEKCTTATDVFAAGCTFFRYCADGGVHPFGNGFNIEGNIMNGIPINVTAQNIRIGDGKDPWKIKLIREMIHFVPEKRLAFSDIVKRLEDQRSPSFLQATLSDFQVNDMGSLPQVIVVQSSRPRDLIKIVGNLQFDRINRIGFGGLGGSVYPGTFNGRKVAVKRVELLGDDVENRELEINQKLSRLNHPNILQFKHYEEDDDFRYFVFELFAASLHDYLMGRYQGPMPMDAHVLFELASGLEYIHSKGILHRDINPKNVLISLTKPVQMKYCGFGLSKPKIRRDTPIFSAEEETQIWKSPEELEMMKGQENEFLHGSIKMSGNEISLIPVRRITHQQSLKGRGQTKNLKLK